MKRTILNLISFLAAPAFGLTIPGILPDPDSLRRDDQNNVIGASGLRLGCIAAITIGAIFASLFIAWLGLLISHGTAAMLSHSEDDDEVADKEVEKTKSQGWRGGITAGSVLGMLFGSIFLVWALVFVSNMVAAINLLNILGRSP
ncbi:hypothetical protein BKA61DRAFT_573688 [Leptodontidium sp. MPI-SDFR-AT-0119]|nr:hypothetical protein BKA61DRAFT_573688 [Leptodontidium sp. MPI-SDFR-AT-0119]